MNARNTFDNPAVVRPSAFEAYRMAGSEVTLNVPAKSVVVVEMK